MAVDYIPLATSPSSSNDEDQERAVHRRRTFPTFSALGMLTRHLTKTRLLILVPLLTLPIIFHLFFTSLLRPSSPTGVDDNPYFFTGDVWKHNDLISARLAQCAELGLLRNTSLPTAELPAEDEAVLIAQGCGTNQTTIVILSSIYFAEAFKGENTAGEVIYAQSVISTLNAYNYAYVFSSLGWWNNDMSKTMELWKEHRWNVRMIMGDPEQVDICWNNPDQACLKTQENPDGIEAWRLMTFWYWDDVRNPLGEQFTLSPSPLNNNTLLSYSIEPTCRRQPLLLSHERAHPPQAYLLAKQGTYFLEGQFVWSTTYFGHLRKALGINIVAGMHNDNETIAAELDRAGVKNFGRLGKMDFYRNLGKSFVLLGVGKPRISPSPWDGLCMGVPYINPVLEWDEADPEDRSKWHAQQWRMTRLQPPYVYHVRAFDPEGLKAALKSALATPIGSYIPPYMRFAQVCEYTATVLNGDWRGKAEEILEERKAEGGKTFEL